MQIYHIYLKLMLINIIYLEIILNYNYFILLLHRMESLKEKTAKGLLWGGLSNAIQQVLNLIFGIFLARLLTQSDYGMVGMLSVFSLMAAALQEGGLISAINRKKEVSANDYNAVFWTCSLISISFYIILFFCSPLIADFFNTPELTSLARYIFIGFFLTSLGVAPRAYLFRNMMVRENTIISISSLLISGITGITLAYYGFAYWGIATQTIIYVFVTTLLSFYYAKWLPSLKIDFSPIKEMIGFSSKLIVTNFFYIINNNVLTVLLGRFYTPHVVGNYTQASKWNSMGILLISNTLNGISQPVFARTENDITRQKNIFRKLLRFTAFISFPAMMGLALIAEELIVILLTDKWIESVRILQILCISGAFYSISGLFSNLIISRGKSATYMWCTIALCTIQLISVCLSASRGIYFMIYVYTFINIAWLLVWHRYAKKEIGIKLREIVKDISPYLVLSTLIVVTTHFATSGISNHYVSFITKAMMACISYCLVLWIFKSTIFLEAIDFLKSKISKLR